MNSAQAAAVVRDRTGLVFSEARRSAFENALAAAMARARTRDLDDYLGRLATRPELLDDLVAEITVGETYFFREPRQLDLVSSVILPDLIARRPPGHRLRIWSAGCATGEEAYTLLMIAREYGLETPPHVIATDLSRPALARAAQARYGRWSLRGVPPEIVERYFERAGDTYCVAPPLRSGVEFGYLNLAEDCYPSLTNGIWGLDLVLCRNVLMYFAPETAARVARRLLDSLAEGGWLVLGASDPLIGELVVCDVIVTGAGLLYRRGARRGGAASAAVVVGAATAATEERPQARPGLTHPVQEDAGVLTPVESLRAAVTIPHPPSRPAAPREPPERPDFAGSVARVRALANRGDLDEAGRVCAAALDAHRDSAELHYLHAVLLAEAGRYADSVRAARAALYLDRELVVAHIVLANASAQIGDPAGTRRALRNAERLLSASPPDTVVPASDGETAGRLGEMVRTRLALSSGMAA